MQLGPFVGTFDVFEIRMRWECSCLCEMLSCIHVLCPALRAFITSYYCYYYYHRFEFGKDGCVCFCAYFDGIGGGACSHQRHSNTSIFPHCDRNGPYLSDPILGPLTQFEIHFTILRTTAGMWTTAGYLHMVGGGTWGRKLMETAFKKPNWNCGGTGEIQIHSRIRMWMGLTHSSLENIIFAVGIEYKWDKTEKDTYLFQLVTKFQCFYSFLFKFMFAFACVHVVCAIFHDKRTHNCCEFNRMCFGLCVANVDGDTEKDSSKFRTTNNARPFVEQQQLCCTAACAGSLFDARFVRRKFISES